MREDSFEDFEELRTVFELDTATGENVVGLGDYVDAYQFEENKRNNDNDIFHVIDEAEGIGHPKTCEHEVFSSSRKSSGEKLSHRKKARTDAYNSEKVCEEVTEKIGEGS